MTTKRQRCFKHGTELLYSMLGGSAGRVGKSTLKGCFQVPRKRSDPMENQKLSLDLYHKVGLSENPESTSLSASQIFDLRNIMNYV
jgi:hypothetical protein